MQPGYFPWAGFYDLMYRVDVFVILDSVKYTKATWRNRNRIRTNAANGWTWLTVPVQKGAENIEIKDVRIDNTSDWAKKHLRLIKENYHKAPYFGLYYGEIEKILSREYLFLCDLDFATVDMTVKALGGSKTEMIRSSDMDVSKDGKTGFLCNICKKLNADYFYDSEGAKSFFDMSVFNNTGITVEFQNYTAPVYRQVYDGFIPALSVLDTIMNCGPDSLKIVLQEYYGKYFSK